MITTIRRYIRAFIVALQFTLRGEKPPLLRVRELHPQLAAWWAQTLVLVGAVERAAETEHVNPAALTIHADKRDVSMTTILATVKFHAERDYPYLMAHNDQFSRMTLNALNINDRYLVMQLEDKVEGSIKIAVNALNVHLATLPADNED